MDIRGMRMQLGDTQSEFAARYKIPFRTVQNWETGVRKPPEYMINLLEHRIREDLINRKTRVLPQYDPQKRDLPKRRDYVGAFSWLRAVRDCIDQPVVFALDEALMCQGGFGGRSDEYLVWVYGAERNSTVLPFWEIRSAPSMSRTRMASPLRASTGRSRTRLPTSPFWTCRGLRRLSAGTTMRTATALRESSFLPNIKSGLNDWHRTQLHITTVKG